MDLTQATGVPETVELGGSEYQVRLLNMREWGVIQGFLKSKVPSPVTQALIALQQARAAGETIGQAAEDQLLDHAQRAAIKWPPRLGSDAWFDALGVIDGGDARLLFEVLSKTDLAFTEEKARALAPTLTQAEWGNLIRVSLYGTHLRPKDEATTETTPPT